MAKAKTYCVCGLSFQTMGGLNRHQSKCGEVLQRKIDREEANREVEDLLDAVAQGRKGNYP